MLTTTDPRDLIAELRALQAELNKFTEQSTCAVDMAHNWLYGTKDSVTAKLQQAGASTVKGPDEQYTPLDSALYDLKDLEKAVHIGKELDQAGSALYDRLDDMARLLELRA